MVQPKVVRERRAELPPLKLERALLERMGKVAEGAIIENILRQKQADGRPLQRNKPSTRDRKIKQGRLYHGKVKSLIDEKRRFVKGRGQSFKSRIILAGRGLLVEPGTGAGRPSIKQLSRWLQEPHPERNRYLGWFGLNKKARKALKTELRKWIEAQFKAAARRFAGSRPEFRRR